MSLINMNIILWSMCLFPPFVQILVFFFQRYKHMVRSGSSSLLFIKSTESAINYRGQQMLATGNPPVRLVISSVGSPKRWSVPRKLWFSIWAVAMAMRTSLLAGLSTSNAHVWMASLPASVCYPSLTHRFFTLVIKG